MINSIYDNLFRSDISLEDKEAKLLRPEIKCNIKVIDKKAMLLQEKEFDWI